ncbi:MAG TPA: hypothetical protein VGE66_17880 [Chitinophagaceae bacterium]
MKKFIPFLLVIFLVACDKDKFETKPQIEIDSYNTKTLPSNASLIINLKFTDKEGDLGTGQFTYIPIRLNRRGLPPSVPDYTPVDVPIPEFSDHNKGEFELKLDWRNLHKSDRENDTIYLRFVAADREGNRSDTVDSDQLVILSQ